LRQSRVAAPLLPARPRQSETIQAAITVALVTVSHLGFEGSKRGQRPRCYRESSSCGHLFHRSPLAEGENHKSNRKIRKPRFPNGGAPKHPMFLNTQGRGGRLFESPPPFLPWWAAAPSQTPAPFCGAPPPRPTRSEVKRVDKKTVYNLPHFKPQHSLNYTSARKTNPLAISRHPSSSV
jgi:hypothetical protein